ncbi:MAG: hypothetical protein CM1200mP29_14870 [Verrucomicrobiota bacterium]|nr:MAG: hypothetical protein CM1200mP29_14870 [Verrucomicrobiota bacterium]
MLGFARRSFWFGYTTRTDEQIEPPKIEKWPFIAGDVALPMMAWLVYYHSEAGFDGLEAFWCFACVAAGAWIMVLPFLGNSRLRLT